jgi:type 2A phosphatase activator TIP41
MTPTHPSAGGLSATPPPHPHVLLPGGGGIDIRGWAVRASHGPIVSTDREAALSAELGIKLPGMTFDASSVSIVHNNSCFSLNFLARDALQGVGRADPSVQVVAAKLWSTRKARDDVPDLPNPSDWTFTTRYAGSISGAAPTSGAMVRNVIAIDLEALRRTDIPILFFSEILLFEDELDDQGSATYTVRIVRIVPLATTCSQTIPSRHPNTNIGQFCLPSRLALRCVQRVMPDFFFVLARFFLRVDGVLLRVYDTRYYHVFGADVIVRERTFREVDYAALDADLCSNPDVAAPNMPITFAQTDNIPLTSS